MTCFLTSSPVAPDGKGLNPENRFVDELRDCLHPDCEALYVCADPDDHERMVGYAAEMKGFFEASGFSFRHYTVLDGQNRQDAEKLVRRSELIILGGGHVPTQNRFFQQIDLRGLLEGYRGVVLGISAGSMNGADVVYAQPEEPGEATDPGYQRFLPGLGLTGTMILPHYQLVRDAVLDGLRVFEDITYPDSVGMQFYALVDGSYVLIRDGKEYLRGEAYMIRDGRLTQIGKVGDTVSLTSRTGA